MVIVGLEEGGGEQCEEHHEDHARLEHDFDRIADYVSKAHGTIFLSECRELTGYWKWPLGVFRV